MLKECRINTCKQRVSGSIVNPVVVISKLNLLAYFSQLYFLKAFFASMMQFMFIISPFLQCLF